MIELIVLKGQEKYPMELGRCLELLDRSGIPKSLANKVKASVERVKNGRCLSAANRLASRASALVENDSVIDGARLASAGALRAKSYLKKSQNPFKIVKKETSVPKQEVSIEQKPAKSKSPTRYFLKKKETNQEVENNGFNEEKVEGDQSAPFKIIKQRPSTAQSSSKVTIEPAPKKPLQRYYLQKKAEPKHTSTAAIEAVKDLPSSIHDSKQDLNSRSIEKSEVVNQKPNTQMQLPRPRPVTAIPKLPTPSNSQLSAQNNPIPSLDSPSKLQVRRIAKKSSQSESSANKSQNTPLSNKDQVNTSINPPPKQPLSQQNPPTPEQIHSTPSPPPLQQPPTPSDGNVSLNNKYFHSTRNNIAFNEEMKRQKNFLRIVGRVLPEGVAKDVEIGMNSEVGIMEMESGVEVERMVEEIGDGIDERRGDDNLDEEGPLPMDEPKNERSIEKETEPQQHQDDIDENQEVLPEVNLNEGLPNDDQNEDELYNNEVTRDLFDSNKHDADKEVVIKDQLNQEVVTSQNLEPEDDPAPAEAPEELMQSPKFPVQSHEQSSDGNKVSLQMLTDNKDQEVNEEVEVPNIFHSMGATPDPPQATSPKTPVPEFHGISDIKPSISDIKPSISDPHENIGVSFGPSSFPHSQPPAVQAETQQIGAGTPALEESEVIAHGKGAIGEAANNSYPAEEGLGFESHVWKSGNESLGLNDGPPNNDVEEGAEPVDEESSGKNNPHDASQLEENDMDNPYAVPEHQVIEEEKEEDEAHQDSEYKPDDEKENEQKNQPELERNFEEEKIEGDQAAVPQPLKQTLVQNMSMLPSLVIPGKPITKTEIIPTITLAPTPKPSTPPAIQNKTPHLDPKIPEEKRVQPVQSLQPQSQPQPTTTNKSQFAPPNEYSFAHHPQPVFRDINTLYNRQNKEPNSSTSSQSIQVKAGESIWHVPPEPQGVTTQHSRDATATRVLTEVAQDSDGEGAETQKLESSAEEEVGDGCEDTVRDFEKTAPCISDAIENIEDSIKRQKLYLSRVYPDIDFEYKQPSVKNIGIKEVSSDGSSKQKKSSNVSLHHMKPNRLAPVQLKTEVLSHESSILSQGSSKASLKDQPIRLAPIEGPTLFKPALFAQPPALTSKSPQDIEDEFLYARLGRVLNFKGTDLNSRRLQYNTYIAMCKKNNTGELGLQRTAMKFYSIGDYDSCIRILIDGGDALILFEWLGKLKQKEIVKKISPHVFKKMVLALKESFVKKSMQRTLMCFLDARLSQTA